MSSIIKLLRNGSLRLFVVIAFLSLLGPSNAEAQRFRRGYGAPIVAPVIPGRYLAPAPPIPSAPSGVRIQTPFFSLNVAPSSSMPPRYSYGYSYQSYRPAYRYGYEYEHVPPSYAPAYRTPDYRVPDYGDYPPVNTPYYGSSEVPLGSITPVPGERLLEDSADVASRFPQPNQPAQLDSLRLSSSTLLSKLASLGEQGQIWIDYLKLDHIISATNTGNITRELVEAVDRFEGVTQNPDLRWLRSTAGFDATYRLLNQWVAYEPVDSDETFTAPIPSGDVTTSPETARANFDVVPPEPKPPTTEQQFPQVGEELLPEPIPTPAGAEPI